MTGYHPVFNTSELARNFQVESRKVTDKIDLATLNVDLTIEAPHRTTLSISIKEEDRARFDGSTT